MPSLIPRGIPASTSRKGLMLAERRRAHFVELYKTGRWKRYFTEHEFLARMREAVREVDQWTAAAALWDEPAATPADAGVERIIPHDIRIDPLRGDQSADDPLTVAGGATDMADHVAIDVLPQPLAVTRDQSVDACESLS
ncbi:MAG: TIGR03809 family protein [Rhodoplanes sp.]|uniref:TIGR03809 family protein n=1 Tax=Rhodoplanes sp. TaxID=1968906 RepID=UPI00184CDF94|nr:TIGR03809 family protein [Rhodoplanes sp.]NVO14712.1 TIGR03809 family protein [Rhodoplanes sp.]